MYSIVDILIFLSNSAVQSPLLPARGNGQHSILHYGTGE